MEQWEYKILEFETDPKGLFTGDTKIGFYVDYVETTSWTGKEKIKAVKKEVSREGMLALFNDLGKESWELIGILPFVGRTGFGESMTNRVNFIFKRKKI